MKIKVVDEIKIKRIDLREIRKNKGLSLKKLAELSGVNWAYLSIVERGEINLVSNKTWKKIKKAINIDKKKNN